MKIQTRQRCEAAVHICQKRQMETGLQWRLHDEEEDLSAESRERPATVISILLLSFFPLLFSSSSSSSSSYSSLNSIAPENRWPRIPTHPRGIPQKSQRIYARSSHFCTFSTDFFGDFGRRISSLRIFFSQIESGPDSQSKILYEYLRIFTSFHKNSHGIFNLSRDILNIFLHLFYIIEELGVN